MQRSQPQSAASRTGAACPVRAALFALCAAAACDPGSSEPDADPDAGAEAGAASDAGADSGDVEDAETDGAPADGAADAADAATDAADAGPREPEALTNNALWQPVEAGDDPFEDRPEQVHCPEGAFGEEPFGGVLTFYVDSAECDYLTASQRTRAPVLAGDEVVVRFKHFPLTGPDAGGAEAHLAFMLGDILIAERTVSIPAEDMEYEVAWKATAPIDEGTPVYFHAHNHGQNEYSVFSIEVRPGE